MKIDPEGFERKFREDIDPWNYRSSAFEAFKRSVLLRACGRRRFARGLELGCANGETTLRLARRCRRLIAVDGAPTAVAAAKSRTAGLPGVEVREGVLPGDLPEGRFDLIVVSELAYYLARRDLERLVACLRSRVHPGGRIVALHHLCAFDDTSLPPAAAHRLLVDGLAPPLRVVSRTATARFACTALLACRRGGRHP